MIRALVICLLASLAAACNPHLYAQSIAPPGRTAKLEAIDGFWAIKAYKVEITSGVALAITCHDGGPCQNMRVVAADPAIADVRRASLQNMEQKYPHYPSVHQMNSAGFVLLGKTPGKTTLKLTSSDGNRLVYVTVVAPPPTGAEATRATAMLPIH